MFTRHHICLRLVDLKLPTRTAVRRSNKLELSVFQFLIFQFTTLKGRQVYIALMYSHFSCFVFLRKDSDFQTTLTLSVTQVHKRCAQLIKSRTSTMAIHAQVTIIMETALGLTRYCKIIQNVTYPTETTKPLKWTSNVKVLIQMVARQI